MGFLSTAMGERESTVSLTQGKTLLFQLGVDINSCKTLSNEECLRKVESDLADFQKLPPNIRKDLSDLDIYQNIDKQLHEKNLTLEEKNFESVVPNVKEKQPLKEGEEELKQEQAIEKKISNNIKILWDFKKTLDSCKKISPDSPESQPCFQKVEKDFIDFISNQPLNVMERLSKTRIYQHLIKIANKKAFGPNAEGKNRALLDMYRAHMSKQDQIDDYAMDKASEAERQQILSEHERDERQEKENNEVILTWIREEVDRVLTGLLKDNEDSLAALKLEFMKRIQEDKEYKPQEKESEPQRKGYTSKQGRSPKTELKVFQSSFVTESPFKHIGEIDEAIVPGQIFETGVKEIHRDYPDWDLNEFPEFHDAVILGAISALEDVLYNILHIKTYTLKNLQNDMIKIRRDFQGIVPIEDNVLYQHIAYLLKESGVKLDQDSKEAPLGNELLRKILRGSQDKQEKMES